MFYRKSLSFFVNSIHHSINPSLDGELKTDSLFTRLGKTIIHIIATY